MIKKIMLLLALTASVAGLSWAEDVALVVTSNPGSDPAGGYNVEVQGFITDTNHVTKSVRGHIDPGQNSVVLHFTGLAPGQVQSPTRTYGSKLINGIPNVDIVPMSFIIQNGAPTTAAVTLNLHK